MKGVLLRLAGLTRNFRLNLARIDRAAGQNNAAVGLSERLLGRPVEDRSTSIENSRAGVTAINFQAIPFPAPEGS